jgi:hypothetical protein
MAEENLLDLQTRTGQSVRGATVAALPVQRSAVYLHERRRAATTTCKRCSTKLATPSTSSRRPQLPLIWQTDAPMEFCEVASMSMELLAAPYPHP